MRGFAFPALLAALAGCAVPSKPSPQSPPPSAAPGREIVRIAAKRPPPLPVAQSQVIVDVRGIRDADVAAVERIREEVSMMTGSSVGLGAVSAVEAFAMPGFMSGSLVAGALILVPLAVGMDAVARRQHERITGALKESDFQAEMRRQIEQRLAKPGAAGAAMRLSAIVIAYGLVPKYDRQPHGPLCLVADVDLLLEASGQVLYRDTVYLEPYRRSEDAPPPVCAAMDRFAARDGTALREAVLQYAEVIAAIANHRLVGLPWAR